MSGADCPISQHRLESDLLLQTGQYEDWVLFC